MAIIYCISNRHNYLNYLILVLASMNILFIAKLPSFHVLHYNVEKIRTIIYLVYLNNVWMLELNVNNKAYFEHNLTLIHELF
jgi:hypothetical protein